MAPPRALREAARPATSVRNPAPSQNDSPGHWGPGKFTTRFYLVSFSSVLRVRIYHPKSTTTEDKSLSKPGARSLPALVRNEEFGNISLAVGIQTLLKTPTILSNIYTAGSLPPHPFPSFALFKEKHDLNFTSRGPEDDTFLPVLPVYVSSHQTFRWQVSQHGQCTYCQFKYQYNNRFIPNNFLIQNNALYSLQKAIYNDCN